jgi:Spherulation-specific family 4
MPKQPSGVLVPAYEYPEPPRWNVLTDVARTMMLGGLLVVANDNSGHFKKADEKYTKAIEALQGACSPVLGYVHDCYDNTGTGALCPRTTDIMDDVDQWFTIYGVDGIFIDQLLRERVEHAERLVQDVLNRRRDAIVVLNPGNIPEEDFMARTHPAIVVIQEDRFADYEGWPPAGWVTNRATEATTSIDANRLAIIAHTLPDPPNTEHVDQFIAKAAQYIRLVGSTPNRRQPRARNTSRSPSISNCWPNVSADALAWDALLPSLVSSAKWQTSSCVTYCGRIVGSVTD